MNEIDNTKQPGASQGKQVVAALNQSDLRSIFHLLVGKPDSTQQQFARRVHVNVHAICDLHERMKDKLANHRIEGLVATVDVSFEDKTTIEFGTWVEFEAFRWTGPKETTDVRLRWEFLVAVEGYEVPQRHAVTVKLSPKMKPFEFMRAVFSKDPSEIDSIEMEAVPIICRVDFVNHVLSKELLAIVDEWVQGLPQPYVVNSWFSWLENHHGITLNFLRYSSPLIAGIAAYMSLEFLFASSTSLGAPISLGDSLIISKWALASILIVYLIDKASSVISHKAYESIQKYGSYRMFQLTNGDTSGAQKLQARNNKQVRNFLLNLSISLIINIIGGVVVFYGWST
ncbi:hypothetical protein [Rheinheimera sp.]|uniref:hypothetical protein n=1 Tax=Rheinheimera sp. TaxID=1869214 RepID=UPI0027359654|nr:hypothetical protein [Rheinheimera sp.]MDP2713400.1 hypothetical protein [Rheinheimera sp.]